MVNKNLFKTGHVFKVAPANAVNNAGGVAYATTNEHALAQYVVTGCFNNTYYSTATDQLAKVKTLLDSVESKFIAQTAVYGHEVAKMKDMPAYLLAVLAARGETQLVASIFNRVITNAKMLCNFVQIIRSGEVGRKSFGTALKRLINNWITSRSANALFNASVGHSQPSFADIIRMTHPHPINDEQSNIISYILGRNYSYELLPQRIKMFEDLKAGKSTEVPDIDFRLVSNINLSTEQWNLIVSGMPWNTLRMNIQNAAKHGVFSDAKMVSRVAAKLSDKEEVQKNNVFPYQLLTAYIQTKDNGGVPSQIINALQQALEFATENVPSYDTSVAVGVDTSGSMSSAITGYGAATTKTRCIDVAALIGSTVLRRNPDAQIVPFDTTVHRANLNGMDAIMTNAQKLAGYGGGGTDCSSFIRHLNETKSNAQVVIMISDNESWHSFTGNRSYFYRSGSGTTMAHEWEAYKKRNKDAKLVLIDLTPNAHTQVSDSKDVLNIGGFSDNVFTVINNFVKFGNTDFVSTIKAVQI